MRFPTLTTVHTQRPYSRTMVLRDIVDTNLIFFTDKRSLKCQEIDSQPSACVHSYAPNLRLQIQFLGTLYPIKEHEKMALWRERGLRRFIDYGSEAPPGAVFPSQPFHNTLENAHQNFLVLGFAPVQIELLKLSSTEHIRLRWSKDQDCWHTERHVP